MRMDRATTLKWIDRTTMKLRIMADPGNGFSADTLRKLATDAADELNTAVESVAKGWLEEAKP